MVETVHKFEAAGLGKAPFRFVGVTKKMFKLSDGTEKPGSSCDYCATGIAYEFWCLSADNRKFKVGCDCIYKIESKTKLYNDVEKAERKIKKDEKLKRDNQRIHDAKIILQNHPTLFASQRHPIDYHANNGKTLRDYVTWLLTNAGASGKLRATVLIEKNYRL